MSIYPDWVELPTGNDLTGSFTAPSLTLIPEIEAGVLNIPEEAVGDIHLQILDSLIYTALYSDDQYQLHVLDKGVKKEVVVQEYISDLAIPVLPTIKNNQEQKDLTTAGLVVLPLIGGGRGPAINNGETITTGLLKTLLHGVITTDEFHPDVLSLLSYIPTQHTNVKNQEGFGTHNDVITLDHDWSGYPPKIEIELGPGKTMGVVQTQVGIDPDCYTYLELPSQEILYGHSGFINDSQFTLKAAILTESTPVVVPLNWTPNDIIGPPVIVTTTESSIVSTTVDCIGFRIKGTLGLTNNDIYAVDGTMYLQISVDNEAWVNAASFRWAFKDNDPGAFTQKFDTFMMFDQSTHDYKFRGMLTLESDDEVNRKLTGSIYIDTVAEVGSGTIISNDIQLKWRVKE